MKQVRSNIFETNSSSSHSFSFTENTSLNDIANEKFEIEDLTGMEFEFDFKPLQTGDMFGVFEKFITKFYGLGQYILYKKDFNCFTEESFCFRHHFIEKILKILNERFNSKLTLKRSFDESLDLYKKFIEENGEYCNSDGNGDMVDITFSRESSGYIKECVIKANIIKKLVEKIKEGKYVYSEKDEDNMWCCRLVNKNKMEIDFFRDGIIDEDTEELKNMASEVMYDAYTYSKDGTFDIYSYLKQLTIDDIIELLLNKNIKIIIDYD